MIFLPIGLGEIKFTSVPCETDHFYRLMWKSGNISSASPAIGKLKKIPGADIEVFRGGGDRNMKLS